MNTFENNFSIEISNSERNQVTLESKSRITRK